MILPSILPPVVFLAIVVLLEEVLESIRNPLAAHIIEISLKHLA
jgi:hypothetical protein